jgi:hypothetical protein
MSRIGAEPAGRFRWAWALAVSFGVLIAVLWMRPHQARPGPNLSPNPLALVAQTPACELVVPAIHVRSRVPRERAGIRDVAVLQNPKGETMIKLQTADPKVVILLEGERTEAE